MGMDCRILCAHSKLEIENDDLWTYMEEHDSDAETTILGEKWYGRKFWNMHRNMSFLQNYKCGEYIELSKDNIEEMLQYLTHHLDYWDGFETVPALCKILYSYDNVINQGYKYFYECDW